MTNYNILRMHGLGNTQIIVQDIGKNCPSLLDEFTPEDLALALCHPNLGVIGADQMMVVSPSEIADKKVQFYNGSTGREAEMCGNGIRCAALAIYEGTEKRKPDLTLETSLCKGNEVKKVRVDPVNRTVSVNMGVVFVSSFITNIEYENRGQIGGYDSFVGNPHFVIPSKDLYESDAHLEYGRKIETNPIFPERTNVEFVRVRDRSMIDVKVWECDDGATLACGTGACAAATVVHSLDLVDDEVDVFLPGSCGRNPLRIIIGAGKQVTMIGPVSRSVRCIVSDEVIRDALADVIAYRGLE